MIDDISTSDLRLLAEMHGAPCVSIYLPTHVAGDGTGQDPIRLRNLVTRAARELEAVGEPSGAIESAVTALLDDRSFWAHQERGLAVFATAERTWTYRLPDEVDELVVVADRFHVKPLLPCVSSGEGFYVLALSRNRVRLLRATRHSAREVALEGIPESLAAALRFDDREPQLQSHSALRTGTGDVAATFHGQGGGKDTRASELDRFLSAVDAGVRSFIGDGADPLVLAGDRPVVARYRKLTRYGRVVDGQVTGNPDRLAADELHRRSWPLVEPTFDRAMDAARARILDRPDHTLSKLPEVVVAARDGRVRSLFVPVGVQSWGRFDAELREIDEHDERRPGDRDLLDVAALDALLTGGAVFAVAPDDVPGDGPVAAELRY